MISPTKKKSESGKMMNEHQTLVWISANGLDKELTSIAKQKSNRENDSIELHNSKMYSRRLSDEVNHMNSLMSSSPEKYDWVLGSVVKKEMEFNNDDSDEVEDEMIMTVLDHDCSQYGLEITIPSSFLKREDIFVMANSDSIISDRVNNLDNVLPPHDLIHLTHLHLPAVVHCLQRRFETDTIYTSTGPILLAVNPFKNCPHLYDNEAIAQYRTAGNQHSSCRNLPPHVFGTADAAFRAMLRGHELYLEQKKLAGTRHENIKVSQSILVSGESGAGKTVSTKHIMRYLANLSDCDVITTTSTHPNTGIQKVLQSNPILESFGNARTIRNDNSSRFGKFIEIQFLPTREHKSATLIGAKIETYLLEKVRLVNQAPGERNYHIFYEMLEGITDQDQRANLFLEDYDASDFKITSMSGTFERRDEVQDGNSFDNMQQAMKTMGFQTQDQTDIMSLISAILHASNLTFHTLSEKGIFSHEECEILQTNQSYSPFLKLMGLSTEKVNTTLCYRKVHARGETYERSLSKEQATKGLEALMKATYGALFDYIVDQINKEISVHGTTPLQANNNKLNAPKNTLNNKSRKDISCFIGVLDIFGFESFKTNSFEQLCINYCNEALQQQFNLFVFTNEQQEYKREGIDWTFIEFPDNQDVLELIDHQRLGIIPILDDQCKAPRGSDKAFAKHMYDRVKKHKRFLTDHLQLGTNKFGILHYAGPVEYDTTGFMEKNKDELPKESTDLLLSSSNPFIQKLAKTMMPLNPNVGVGGGNTPARRNTKLTVGGQFIQQLRSLRTRIGHTNPHYVRCLKPNCELLSEKFDKGMIASQLRHAGVLEAVRVTRVAFPQRFTNSQFLQRYFNLAVKNVNEVPKSNIKQRCQELTNALIPQLLNCDLLGQDLTKRDVANGGLVSGKTKVFLRNEAFEKLEYLRTKVIWKSIIKIQASARTYLTKRKYQETMKAIVIVQNIVRMVISKNKAAFMKQISSSIIIQKNVRMRNARRFYTSCTYIAHWCHAMQRGRVARQIYTSMNKERQITILQNHWRMYILAHSYRQQRNAVLRIQCAVRVCKAKRILKKLKSDAKSLQNIVNERNTLQQNNKRLQDELDSLKRAMEKQKLGKTHNKHILVRPNRDSLKSETKRISKKTATQSNHHNEKKPTMASEITSSRRKHIRVGKSKIIRERRLKRKKEVREKDGGMKNGKDNKKKIDDELISNVLSILDSRKSDESLELEMLRAETEQLKANFRTLKKKYKHQKNNTEAQVQSAPVRAPAMTCAFGPVLQKAANEISSSPKRGGRTSSKGDIPVHPGTVRAPAMTCAIGPFISNLFAKASERQQAEEEHSRSPRDKNFFWWQM